MIRTGPTDSLRSVGRLSRSEAPRPRSCIVVQEIFGLTPWIRSVADQLAADGFIAIAPDFVDDEESCRQVRQRGCRWRPAATRSLNAADVQRQLHGGRAIWNVAAGGAAKIRDRWILLGRWNLIRSRGSFTDAGRRCCLLRPEPSGPPTHRYRARPGPWTVWQRRRPRELDYSARRFHAARARPEPTSTTFMKARVTAFSGNRAARRSESDGRTGSVAGDDRVVQEVPGFLSDVTAACQW